MGLKNPLLLRVETTPADSLSASYRPDAQASISLQSYSGDFKLISNSFQEYKFTNQGLHKHPQHHALSGNTFCQISEKDIELLDPLGEGASSTVYKAWWNSAQKYVAIKSINCMEKEKRKQMLNDIKGLSDVSHPTLVQFFGAYRSPDGGQISLVLELLDRGSLADLTKQAGKVPEHILASISAQILQGLIYLHKTRHTVHRDIKPANILLNSSGQVKIADFGISAFVDNTLAVCNTFLGTVTYMSPERINSKPYSFAADIWSLGLSLLECVTGRYPFDAAAGPLVLMMQILKDGIPMPSRQAMSGELRDFLERCLCKDPYERADAEELLHHPFITQERSDSQEILKEYFESIAAAADRKSPQKQVIFPTVEAVASRGEVRHIVDRHFASLSAGSLYLRNNAADFAGNAIMVHEGVESRGKAAVLRKLGSVCELQHALGTNRMVVDCIQMQSQDDAAVVVLANGHLEMTNAGPLGSAILGSFQNCLFASTFEIIKLACGKLAISKLMFCHL